MAAEHREGGEPGHDAPLGVGLVSERDPLGAKGKLQPATHPVEHAAPAKTEATPAKTVTAKTASHGDWTSGPHLEGAVHPHVPRMICHRLRTAHTAEHA